MKQQIPIGRRLGKEDGAATHPGDPRHPASDAAGITEKIPTRFSGRSDPGRPAPEGVPLHTSHKQGGLRSSIVAPRDAGGIVPPDRPAMAATCPDALRGHLFRSDHP